MKNLDVVVQKLESELDEKDQIREVAIKSSRAIVRLSGSVIRSTHTKETSQAALEELKDEVSRLTSLLSEHPELSYAGYVETAFQEYAEAGIVMSILEKDDVPSPEELGVQSVPYLLGLGDCVGELRRFCLDELKAGRVRDANRFLERMEDIFVALMRFDYPDAIVAIRRKQDVARSILEKTRGEVAVSASARSLEEKLDQVLRMA